MKKDTYAANPYNPGRQISYLSNTFRRKLDQLSVNTPYSGAQGKALHFILANQNRDIFQKDIEKEYNLRPPTASELLKKMEQSGLIIRESVPYDARKKRIVATDLALQYTKQVVHDLNELDEILSAGISEEDLAVFERVVNQMIENMTN